MAQPSIFDQILDYSHRANPYPLYAELRKTPVTRQADGSYVISTYPEIVSLLHDPRISSDMRNSAGAAAADTAEASGLPPSFLQQDPPGHDRLRRMTMRHFGPPNTPARIAGLEPELLGIVTKLIDGLAGRNRIDIVDDLAYPFPVAVICELLGIPHEDEPRFHAWVEKGMEAFDPKLDPAEQQRAKAQAVADLSRYLTELVETHRRAPGDDLLSGMATDDGPEGQMPTDQIVSIAMLLLIAGHETTVNLIANGMLTLLRHRRPVRVIPVLDAAGTRTCVVFVLAAQAPSQPPWRVRDSRPSITARAYSDAEPLDFSDADDSDDQPGDEPSFHDGRRVRRPLARDARRA